jgi:hypothetical protein
MHWRRRAVLTAGVVTAAEYEAAWAFVEDVRKAAAAAARAAVSRLAAGGPFPHDFPPMNGRADRRAPDVVAATHTGGSKGTRLLPPAPRAGRTAAPADTNVPASVFAAAVAAAGPGGVATDASWRGLVPRAHPDAGRLASSARQLEALPAGAPVPPTVGDDVFTFAHLPDTVRILRTQYTPAQLAGLGRTLSRLALPLLRMLERVAVRAVPSAAQVAAEIAEADAVLAARGAPDSASTSASGAADVATWRALYAVLPLMMDDGPVPQPAPGVDASGQPAAAVAAAATDEPRPPTAWAGNDDARVKGSLRNPMRLGLYSQHWLLTAGRRGFEEAIAQVYGDGSASASGSGSGSGVEEARGPVSSSSGHGSGPDRAGPRRRRPSAGAAAAAAALDAAAGAGQSSRPAAAAPAGTPYAVVAAHILGRRLPTGFSGAGSVDAVATTPRALLFRALTTPLHSVASMGSEAGWFLPGVCGYDTLAAHAQKAKIIASEWGGLSLVFD